MSPASTSPQRFFALKSVQNCSEHLVAAVGLHRFAALILVSSIVATLNGCGSRSDCPACSTDTLDPRFFERSGSQDPQLLDIEYLLQSADTPPQLLFLSGGGSYGAWGAGVLSAWPNPPEEFDIVTGVSTGALLAPLAYLGETRLGDSYDETLRTYTQVGNSDIFVDRSPLLIPFSNSLKTTEPLEALLEKHINDNIIDKIAEAYKESRGRRKLYVGIVDLDRGEFIRANLTEMAAAKKHQMFRETLLASAAIPVIFPPVFIKDTDTMFVDGGAREQVFAEFNLEPYLKIWDLKIQSFADRKKELELFANTLKRRPTVYVIVNGKLSVSKHCVDDHIVPIASRSVSVLLTEAVIGSLYKIHFFMEKNRLNLGAEIDDRLTWDFQLSYIPEDYTLDFAPYEFSENDMKALFDKGRVHVVETGWEEKIPTHQTSTEPCI
jgi:hypothetical protein